MKSAVAQRIGDAVRLELVHQGKTQVDLARALGMPQATLSRRVNGTTTFRADELAEVATYLGVTINDLYAGPGRVAVA